MGIYLNEDHCGFSISRGGRSDKMLVFIKHFKNSMVTKS